MTVTDVRRHNSVTWHTISSPSCFSLYPTFYRNRLKKLYFIAYGIHAPFGMPFASYVLQSRGDKTLVPGEIHGAEEQRCKRATQMISSR